jgi:probable HAF family extracellular repeat protein
MTRPPHNAEANKMSPYKYITLTDPVGSSTAPLGIGDEGQVIGFYRDGNGDAHGFLYSGGVTRQSMILWESVALLRPVSTTTAKS